VNFFGHAAAACRVDDDPAFILGAMAPDLLPLCGAVPAGETSPKVAAGRAHHLSVDATFHANPAFTSLSAWASRVLTEGGLPRGPARAAAHVGIELCLDGVLAVERSARTAYARSLVEADGARAPSGATRALAHAGRAWSPACAAARYPMLTAIPTS
jgi:hypothetical protein